MILQKFFLPKGNSSDEQTLYFRGNRIHVSGDLMIIDAGGCVSFDTYYNLFSVDKWKRYTVLSDLYLYIEADGEFVLDLFEVRLRGKLAIRKRINSISISADKKESFRFPIQMDQIKGNCYVRLYCEKSGVVYSMSWETGQPAVRNVNFAVDMCTYKKQEHVKKNIELLNREIFLNQSSVLYGRTKLFLVDNENSEKYLSFSSENIYVYRNGNVGGSGGFARGMLEVLKKNKEFPATHVILMDDDVSVRVSSLERTYTFLCFMKKEYHSAFVGGSILQMGKEYIQSEQGGRFRFSGGFGMHSNVDLRNLQKVLENDRGSQSEYIPWCYCCIPLDCVREGLPLPVFLHHDDAEYAMRVASHCICMNGISILHKPNCKKRPSPNAYYNVRNLLIVISLHKRYMPRLFIKMYVVMKVTVNLMLARYKDALLNIKGVQDYLRGPEWLVCQNPEEKHKEICESGYRYETGLIENEITGNGYKVFRIGEDSVWESLFYQKLCYINDENKFFCVERNRRSKKHIRKELFRVLQRLGREYCRIKKEYQRKIPDMTTVDFWQDYLEQVK